MLRSPQPREWLQPNSPDCLVPYLCYFSSSVIGNVATEMTGQSVLQTNSPYNRVTTALSSASKTKQVSSIPSAANCIRIHSDAVENSWLAVFITLSVNPIATTFGSMTLLDCRWCGPDREARQLIILSRHSFPNLTAAQEAFAAFDRDDNGDATRDEIEMACMQLHREKMSLEASMKDLDGAVRRLDDVSFVYCS